MLIDEALQQALDNLNEILVPGKYAKKMSDSMANIQSVISVVQNARVQEQRKQEEMKCEQDPNVSE